MRSMNTSSSAVSTAIQPTCRPVISASTIQARGATTRPSNSMKGQSQVTVLARAALEDIEAPRRSPTGYCGLPQCTGGGRTAGLECRLAWPRPRPHIGPHVFP
ncbi:hypothetical protein G6F68_017407 [Rhizopus microsporus]|nr:hypothetical protein G6F68_017407 [Rhizopus microsporus]